MPRIARRSDTDISNFRTHDFVSIDYLFDVAHFKTELDSYCPQLKIYDTMKDVPGYENITKFDLSPDHLPKLTPSHRVFAKPDEYKPAFDEWLGRVNTKKVSPVHISFTNRIIWTWPTSYDPPAFIRSFGTVVKIRSDIRNLAALALFKLKSNYGLPRSFRAIDISSPEISYVGIHLRAEKDSRDYGFTDYDTQALYFARRLSEFPGIPVYLASGDRDVTANFTESIAPVRVVTKQDLLSDVELRLLSWDQQALLDLLVLERASYFLGVKDSSFSWLLTLRRAAAENWVVGGFPTAPCLAKREDGRKIRRGCEKDLADSEFWRDELSALVGNKHPGPERVEVYRASIFP